MVEAERNSTADRLNCYSRAAGGNLSVDFPAVKG